MNKAVYAVLQIGAEWRVVCERRHIGHFDNRQEALTIAAGLVRQALEAGHQAELLALDPTNKLVGERFGSPEQIQEDFTINAS
jgi:hypothetical protein